MKFLRRFSRATYIWASILIISSTFLRGVQLWLEQMLGGSGLSGVIWFALLAAVVIVISSILRSQLRTRLVPLACILIIGVLVAKNIENPVERVHLLKYGVLGWLAASDTSRGSIQASILLSVTLGVVVSTIDEVLQSVLPQRIGDTRDVVFGAIGSFLGAAFHQTAKRI